MLDPEAHPDPERMADPGTGKQQNSESTARKDHEEIGLEEVCSNIFTYGVNIVDRDMKAYFEHLDTRTFLRRLVRSIVPSTKYEDLLTRPDLYGPLVLSFALSSSLHFAFKKADPAPLDRHLGTSLLLCFGSLVTGSLLLDVAWQYSAAMVKQSPAKYGLDRAFCLVGYSFLGPCAVLLLHQRIHRFLFFPLALGLEVGSAMSFGTAAARGSQSQSNVLGAACAVLHIIWLYNLRAVLNSFELVMEDIT